MSKFEALGIRTEFIKGLSDLGIIEPTYIQKKVIPLLLDGGTDLVGQAQTGTGKTAAFGLPLLHNISPEIKKIQGLVLCPTRELGQQVAKQLFKYTKYLSEPIFTEAVFGGAPIDKQIASLTRPTHIVVATPGRLIDLINRKAVDLSDVHTLVLDEADEMLSMGFKAELDEILKTLSNVENKWLFSATMPHGIKEIVTNYMSKDAHRIEVSGREIVNKQIMHQFIVCNESDKFYILTEFLKSEHTNRGVIFCKTKVATQKLTKQLIAKNIAADCIHGDLLQKERDKAMRAFKNTNVQVLVATDVAARGIDIEGLSYVVHYQLPENDEYYTHRSGRTARAGKEGVSLAIVTSDEVRQIRKYEKFLGISFREIKPVKK